VEGENEYLRYYHFDALGSTRLLTNSSGTETDSYTYDAWGRQTAHSGSTAQPYRFVGQLGYYTHYQDDNLFTEGDWQLLHLGVRFHDPQVGRFTQTDPSMDWMNLYAYANDRPTILPDPSGQAVWRLCDFLKKLPKPPQR
jgi:RHS repeat-associated protein